MAGGCFSRLEPRSSSNNLADQDACDVHNASNDLVAHPLQLLSIVWDEVTNFGQDAGPNNMTTREELVLAHRDPTIEDENDWEEFILKDVKIYYQGKSRLASLLAATEEAPVCVTGVLQRLDEDQEHLGE